MDEFVFPAERSQATPQESPPSYIDCQNYTSPPPRESPSGPPPTYKHKRTPSQEEIYIKELKAWAAEKEKMYPGAYGEYANTPLSNPRTHNNRLSHPSTEPIAREAQDHDIDSDAHEQRDLATPSHTVESTSAMPIPVTRRKDSVGEYETAKKGGTGTSASKESGIKKRMSSFIHKMGMSKTENRARDGEAQSEALDTGDSEREPVEEVEERVE